MLRQALTASFGAMLAGQGANASGYADTLAHVVGPGQKLQGVTRAQGDVTKAQQARSDLAKEKGSFEQQFEDEFKQNEAKNVLAGQIAQVNTDQKQQQIDIQRGNQKIAAAALWTSTRRTSRRRPRRRRRPRSSGGRCTTGGCSGRVGVRRSRTPRRRRTRGTSARRRARSPRTSSRPARSRATRRTRSRSCRSRRRTGFSATTTARFTRAPRARTASRWTRAPSTSATSARSTASTRSAPRRSTGRSPHQPRPDVDQPCPAEQPGQLLAGRPAAVDGAGEDEGLGGDPEAEPAARPGRDGHRPVRRHPARHR
jgi:hypothetical protein